MQVARLLPLLLVPILAGCSDKPQKGRPNVLLVSMDTLRADHCSVYGYKHRTTPVLERLAEEGVLFKTAFAPMATTGPSHATMFTGRYPLEHGVVKNGLTLPPSERTLAEVFEAAGYDTSATVSSFALNGKFGYQQGFAAYDDVFEGADASDDRKEWLGHEVTGNFDRRGGETNESALAWFDQRKVPERPWFAWVHYFDPHHPYDPPSPYRGSFPPPDEGDEVIRAEIARYDAEVLYTDAMLGELLAALESRGQMEDTVVIVVGDHGEGLMDHGDQFHGITLYEEQIRVPFLFHAPGRIPAGRRIDGPVELRDLAPTVLELVGLVGEIPEGGISLVAAFRGAPLQMDRALFFQRRHYTTQRLRRFKISGSKFAVRRGGWKYIEAEEEGTRELFDLRNDPGEHTDVAARFPELVEALSRDLKAWREARSRGEVEHTIDEADMRKLEALGYAR